MKTLMLFVTAFTMLFGSTTFASKVDPRLVAAAEIAKQRAKPHSTEWCWRYVKQAMVLAKAIASYPKTVYAKQGAEELIKKYGFRQLSVQTPDHCPPGTVLFYSSGHHIGEGHVELRLKDGYVSDFFSRTPFTALQKLHGHQIHPVMIAALVLPKS